MALMDLRDIEHLSPREFHGRREAERLAVREAVRGRVLAQARDAITVVAPQHPSVREVYVFGSVLQPGRFRRGSDLDIAVVCDDLEAETPFARALERQLHRAVDLRPFAGAVAEAVAECGEKVYG
jgi:predicted nucleotidyltransferase